MQSQNFAISVWKAMLFVHSYGLKRQQELLLEQLKFARYQLTQDVLLDK